MPWAVLMNALTVLQGLIAKHTAGRLTRIVMNLLGALKDPTPKVNVRLGTTVTITPRSLKLVQEGTIVQAKNWVLCPLRTGVRKGIIAHLGLVRHKSVRGERFLLLIR